MDLPKLIAIFIVFSVLVSYLVDIFLLLASINSVFCSPCIVKILHLTDCLCSFQDEDESQSDVTEYEYGSQDKWDIRPKTRTRERLGQKACEREEGEGEEEDIGGEGYKPKMNGK